MSPAEELRLQGFDAELLAVSDEDRLRYVRQLLGERASFETALARLAR